MIFELQEMNTFIDLSLCEYGDEDYIDMELCSSPSSILCCSTNSSPQSREFEFQMSITFNERETTTSPADDLFFQGKLLPLYRPPRRLMVENLLHTTAAAAAAATFKVTKEAFEEDQYYSTPFLTPPSTTTLSDHSCNISPSESSRVSCELSPDDYFFEWSNELNSFINTHPTKMTWSKKLMNSILGLKLKASKAYLKSLFTTSTCSNDSSAKAKCSNGRALNVPKSDESSTKYSKMSKKKPLEHINIASNPTIASIMKNIDKEGIEDSVQRRSFSGAIKRHSQRTKCSSSSSSNSSSGASSSSSSFSLNSNGFHELHFLRRSSSATELEGSIEAAIAHCKNSQQHFRDYIS